MQIICRLLTTLIAVGFASYSEQAVECENQLQKRQFSFQTASRRQLPGFLLVYLVIFAAKLPRPRLDYRYEVQLRLLYLLAFYMLPSSARSVLLTLRPSTFVLRNCSVASSPGLRLFSITRPIFSNMSDLKVELTAPNGRKITLPTGLFINNEFVKSTSSEKVTSINPS